VLVAPDRVVAQVVVLVAPVQVVAVWVAVERVAVGRVAALVAPVQVVAVWAVAATARERCRVSFRPPASRVHIFLRREKTNAPLTMG